MHFKKILIVLLLTLSACGGGEVSDDSSDGSSTASVPKGYTRISMTIGGSTITHGSLGMHTGFISRARAIVDTANMYCYFNITPNVGNDIVEVVQGSAGATWPNDCTGDPNSCVVCARDAGGFGDLDSSCTLLCDGVIPEINEAYNDGFLLDFDVQYNFSSDMPIADFATGGALRFDGDITNLGANVDFTIEHTSNAGCDGGTGEYTIIHPGPPPHPVVPTTLNGSPWTDDPSADGDVWHSALMLGGKDTENYDVFTCVLEDRFYYEVTFNGTPGERTQLLGGVVGQPSIITTYGTICDSYDVCAQP